MFSLCKRELLFSLILILFPFAFANELTVLGHVQIIQADSFSDATANIITLLYESTGIVYHLEFSEQSKNDSEHIINSHLANIAYFSHSQYNLGNDLRTLRVKVSGEQIFSNQMNSSISIHTNELSMMVAKHKKIVWGDNHRILKISSIERLYFVPNNRKESNDLNIEERGSQQSVNLRRMVVMLINMKDADITCDVQQVDAEMWKNDFSVKGLYEINSFGQVEFAGDIEGRGQWDIYGPFTIDYKISDSESTCDSDNWANQADQMAMDIGVNLENYQHRVYAIPRKTSKVCTWEGLGWVGCGLYCRAWINTCDRMEVFVHELGHNLGMTHASSNWNEAGKISTYGDPTAFMGNSFFSSNDQLTFNAPHRDQVSWFSNFPNKLVTISNNQGDNMYYLSPVNELPLNAEYAQAVKAIHPDTGQPYYFSFITVMSKYSSKCLVHNWPNSTAPTFILKTMDQGDYFVDMYSRFSATVWMLNEDVMQLWIVYGCQMQNTLFDFFTYRPNLEASFSAFNSQPFVNWTDSISVQVYSGQNITFTIRLANADSPLCTPVEYIVSPSIPSEWDYYIIESITLSPGQSCFLEYSVFIPQSYPSGVYNISFFVNGTTEDGIYSPLHEDIIYAQFIVTNSGEATCSYNSPIINIASDVSQVYYSPGQSIAFAFSIENKDANTCASSLFYYNVSLPSSDWTYSIAKRSETLYPEDIAYNTLSIKAPLLLNSTGNFSVELSVSNAHHFSQISINLVQAGSCDLPPVLNIIAPVFSLNTRESVSTTLQVIDQRGEHCLPTILSLSSSNPKASLVPTLLSLNAGETLNSVIMFTAPLDPSAFNINDSIEIAVGEAVTNNLMAKSQILIQIEETECVVNAPLYYIACPPVIDNSTGIARCWIFLQNQDTWPCPTTTWKVSIVLSASNSWSWNIPNDWPLFPGNSSGWEQFNISLGRNSWINGLNISIGVEDITTNSSTVKNLHAGLWQANLPVGKCIRVAPTLQFTSTSASMYLGQTVPIPFTITNNDNVFCQYTQLYYGQAAEPVIYAGELNKNGFFGQFAPGAVALQYQQSAQMALYLTSLPNGLHPPFNSTFNMTVTLIDISNATHLSNMNISVWVNNSCTILAPDLSVSPSVNYVPVGQSRSVNYILNVTNNDNGTCGVSTWGFGASIGWPSAGWAFSVNPNAVSNLGPSQSGQTVFTVQNRENIGSGDYEISVGIYDTYNPYFIHGASNLAKLTVECTMPRSPINLQATPIRPFFSFGLQGGPVFIEWEACTNSLWCCCPCKYHVDRDGVEIGVSDTLNFTDTAQLEVGRRYIYTITTVDRNGRKSSAVVCDNVLAVEIQPLPYKQLLHFMIYVATGLAALGIISQIIRLIIHIRSNSKKGKEIRIMLQLRKIFAVCCGSCGKRNSKPLLELRQMDVDEKDSLLDDYD